MNPNKYYQAIQNIIYCELCTECHSFGFLFALGGCSQNVVILVSLCGLEFGVAQSLCAPHLYVCKQLKIKIQNGGSILYALCLCQP
jgi:hypothetical protein